MALRLKKILALGVVAVIGATAGWRLARPSQAVSAEQSHKAKGGLPNDCSVRVTKAELEQSIDLGTRYMAIHTKPAGNFDYEYDWKAKTYTQDDSPPRQAGALWGLALLHQYAGGPAKASPELRAALKRSLEYFDNSSGTTKDGGRYPIYRGDGDKPTESKGGMGTAALVTLGLIDYVRSLPPDDADRERWLKRTQEYVSFLAGAIKSDGTWPGDYRYDNGEGVGHPSPYSDGETLLAVVEAMKYLGRDDLRPMIEKAAVAGHRINVEEALAKEPDSATTKGYYQWSSMSYYELATSKLGTSSPAAPYGDWLLALADWVIDVHGIIGKPRNTGYAYEGILSALAWAKEKKDPRAEKYSCTAHLGLATLMGWQVGHPRAAALGKPDDPKAIGGVQNHATEPPLRIDTVQHQMHATMLALEHLF